MLLPVVGRCLWSVRRMQGRHHLQPLCWHQGCARLLPVPEREPEPPPETSGSCGLPATVRKWMSSLVNIYGIF